MRGYSYNEVNNYLYNQEIYNDYDDAYKEEIDEDDECFNHLKKGQYIMGREEFVRRAVKDLALMKEKRDLKNKQLEKNKITKVKKNKDIKIKSTAICFTEKEICKNAFQLSF